MSRTAPRHLHDYKQKHLNANAKQKLYNNRLGKHAFVLGERPLKVLKDKLHMVHMHLQLILLALKIILCMVFNLNLELHFTSLDNSGS